MATPSELIEKARRGKQLRKLRVGAVQEPETPEAEVIARPLPTNHASYSRLMHSHDRVRTRHLSKSGGGGIA